MHSREWQLPIAKIVDIELFFCDLRKSMPQIKPVGSALSQGTDTNRQTHLRCFGKDLLQRKRSDATPLKSGQDVEVVQQEIVGIRLHYKKTNMLAIQHDMSGRRSIKTIQEALARSHRIETADVLQTLAHGSDASGDQRLSVGRCSQQECDVSFEVHNNWFESAESVASESCTQEYNEHRSFKPGRCSSFMRYRGSKREYFLMAWLISLIAASISFSDSGLVSRPPRPKPSILVVMVSTGIVFVEIDEGCSSA
jgi:hypothetical protein